MSQTKQFFIDKAFEELGLASYVFDMQPEDYKAALDRLNGMVGEWEGEGVFVGGFPVPNDPQDPNDTVSTVTNVPVSNWRCLWTSLAVVLAPTVGRTPEGPTIAYASRSFRALLMRRVEIPEMQRPSTMPIGTGWNRGIKDRQFYQQQATLTTGAGQSLDVDVWDRGDNLQPIPNPTP